MLFLSRLAFICNIFSLLAILVQLQNVVSNKEIISIIGIMGYFMAIIINPLANFVYLVLLLRKKLFSTIPRWLVLANFIFLILQLQYILFLNDQLHN